jgi:hypothetical protein
LSSKEITANTNATIASEQVLSTSEKAGSAIRLLVSMFETASATPITTRQNRTWWYLSLVKPGLLAVDHIKDLG